jgi:hypothetical protein
MDALDDKGMSTRLDEPVVIIPVPATGSVPCQMPAASHAFRKMPCGVCRIPWVRRQELVSHVSSRQGFLQQTPLQRRTRALLVFIFYKVTRRSSFVNYTRSQTRAMAASAPEADRTRSGLPFPNCS